MRPPRLVVVALLFLVATATLDCRKRSRSESVSTASTSTSTVAATAPAAKPAPVEWDKFVSTEGRFTALFTGSPTHSEGSVDTIVGPQKYHQFSLSRAS